MRCPGSDSRNLRVELHKCPKCGVGVELFFDESRVRCQKCGQILYREKTPNCIDWCASAKECLGEAKWRKLIDEN